MEGVAEETDAAGRRLLRRPLPDRAPNWGGSYEGAMVVDGLLAFIWALARCYLAAALWTKALDPALLGGRRSLWRLTPLAVIWLITTQCIAGLGSLMPLAAELWAGEPWLEAIYPHGQLIWTALSLAGWLPALLAGMLWYKLRGGRIPGRRWAAAILGAVAWALILWGLRVAADALAISDACLTALVLDALSLAGPALLLADLAVSLAPLSQGETPTRWSGLLSLLWAPAVWFFTQYGFALRMLEAVADYGSVRDWVMLPLDVLGDVAQAAALWLFVALCAARCLGRPLSQRDFGRCWPACPGGGDGCAGPFRLLVPAAGGHLCRRVSGAALFGLGGCQPVGPDDGAGLCHMDGLRFAARETLAL